MVGLHRELLRAEVVASVLLLITFFFGSVLRVFDVLNAILVHVHGTVVFAQLTVILAELYIVDGYPIRGDIGRRGELGMLRRLHHRLHWFRLCCLFFSSLLSSLPYPVSVLHPPFHYFGALNELDG